MPMDEHWSLERTAGLEVDLSFDNLRFTGPGRCVEVNLLVVCEDGSPEQFVASLLDEAPEVPPGQQLTERLPDGVRHACWLASESPGGVQHKLYGFRVHEDGTAGSVICTWDKPEDLEWAQHVWRSVNRHS